MVRLEDAAKVAGRGEAACADNRRLFFMSTFQQIQRALQPQLPEKGGGRLLLHVNEQASQVPR